MEELVFNTTLSEEEIDNYFQNTDIFSELMSSLDEAHAFASGSAKKETVIRKRNLPDIDVASEKEQVNSVELRSAMR